MSYFLREIKIFKTRMSARLFVSLSRAGARLDSEHHSYSVQQRRHGVHLGFPLQSQRYYYGISKAQKDQK